MGVLAQQGEGPSADLVRVEVTEHGSTAVVTACGELDLCSTPSLRGVVEQVIEAPLAEVVVVDLTGVEFVAVVGMRALREAYELAAKRGKLLRVVASRSHAVIALMVGSGLLRGMVVFDDLGQALLADRGGCR